MRDIPAIAREQCGVFSTQQASDAGWTASALHHAVRTGGLRRLRVGAYQAADLAALSVPDRYEEARWLHAAPAIAAVLTTYGSAASHSTAAVLRRIPLIFLPGSACITVLPWHTGDVPRIHLHRCTRTATVTAVGQVDCLSGERTALDLAREHGATAGVVALDFLLHERRVTRERISDELSRMSRWPGVRAARDAFALADGHSESVLESRSRMRFAEFAIPTPETQVRVANEWGGFVARVDFYWDEFGVVGEADGDVKYDGSNPESLISEKKRQQLLEDLGLSVVRWGSAELRNFIQVADRLRRAFDRSRRFPDGDRRWRVLPAL